MYKGVTIRLMADISSETMQGRIQKYNSFKVLRKRAINQKFYMKQNYLSKVKKK